MRNSIAAALAAVLMAPAAAQADVVTFGSDLRATPTRDQAEAHQADTLFFNTPKGGNGHQSPVAGQILEVRVKGTAIAAPDKAPNTLFHTQVLRDNGNGTFHVDSSSQHFYFPYDVPPETVTSYVPSTQCVEQGQTVDFNNVGGYDADPNNPNGTRYQDGVPYQIFAARQGSQVFWYERDNGTGKGATFAPNRRVYNNPDGSPRLEVFEGPRENKELMMQVVVGTGPDASNLCPGGHRENAYRGVTVVQPWRNKIYDNGVARVRLSCPSNTYGTCRGRVALEAESVEIGSSSEFKLRPNDTSNVTIPLTNQGARIVNMRGQLEAAIAVESRDELGVAVPTEGRITLTAARPTGARGFAGLIVKKQTLKARGRTPQLRVTCPAGSAGACGGSIKLVTAKRVGGKLVKVGTARFLVVPGKVDRVGIKLTSAGKKLLRRSNKAYTIATIKARDVVGVSKTARAKVTLTRR